MSSPSSPGRSGDSRTPPPPPPPRVPPAPPRPSWDPGEPEQVSWLRPTIRIRLTLLFGGMFLTAGVILLTIIYLVAAQALNAGNAMPFQLQSDTTVTITSDVCPNISGSVSSENFQEWTERCADTQRAIALDKLLRRSLLALLGMTVAAFAFGYVMAGRVLSPLGRITRTARRVAGSDLHRRIELDGPDDELKELADTFDEMLERLQRAFTAQQRFVGNASHELRTPLAISQTLLEVARNDPTRDQGELLERLHTVNARAIDLTEALFEHRQVEINVTAILGNVEIRVPENVTLRGTGSGVLGSCEVRTAEAADPNAPGDLAGEIRVFLDAGMDGFFTDNPDIGAEVAG